MTHHCFATCDGSHWAQIDAWHWTIRVSFLLTIHYHSQNFHWFLLGSAAVTHVCACNFCVRQLSHLFRSSCGADSWSCLNYCYDCKFSVYGEGCSDLLDRFLGVDCHKWRSSPQSLVVMIYSSDFYGNLLRCSTSCFCASHSLFCSCVVLLSERLDYFLIHFEEAFRAYNAVGWINLTESRERLFGSLSCYAGFFLQSCQRIHSSRGLLTDPQLFRFNSRQYHR